MDQGVCRGVSTAPRAATATTAGDSPEQIPPTGLRSMQPCLHLDLGLTSPVRPRAVVQPANLQYFATVTPGCRLILDAKCGTHR